MKYVLLTFWSLCLVCCNPTTRDALIIATAANMQFAMPELVEAFESKYQIPSEVILGSSGKLTAQIKEGAPYHLFISADDHYPAVLHGEGLTTSAPVLYAYGQLILWSMNAHIVPRLSSLNDHDIKHIAVANPKTAPYGVGALQALESAGILDAIGSKLVYGESIAQVNQFIVSGAADIGITAKSVVMSDQMKHRGDWVDIDSSHYRCLPQSAVILSRDDHRQQQAQTFLKFLASEEARSILTEYGYLVP